jgi:ubiquinone/menaquinone biosynthesis C-methylase UbiE
MSDKKEQVGKKTVWGDSWSHENAIQYYSLHRNSVKDTYESERFFLSRIIKPECSILDIGCATGGFYNIFKEYEQSITYTGVDISSEMIRQARILHPGVHFKVTDGSNLPFERDSFDIVFSSGALHMTPNWREILAEGWRVAKSSFLFDVRIKELPPSIEDANQSYQKIEFSGVWDGKTIVPYIIIDIKTFMQNLASLHPTPVVRQIHGYYHPVSDMTISPEKQVYMMMCCLIKNASCGEKDLWDFPIPRQD